MNKELGKIYNPNEVEERIYKFWETSGFFHAQVNKDKKPYTIVIPPPNITGQLHMGHALDETLQDILIRFKRMKGYESLWVPGTDHAAIATEVKIVEEMRKEGLSKEQMGRDEFLKRAWKWKEKYGGKISNQIRRLGASCDWERERFTMDDGCTDAVKEFFVLLYEKGLIYRGKRIINWCPECLTSISDAEVEFKETEGDFWHIKYPLADGTGFLELATTRPETIPGDTAVAVNPDDERYANMIGKMVIIPILNKEIPIIADNYVEKDFGTGVVKITPAHDPNDFEVGIRHNLPVVVIMDENAVMNEAAGKYKGMNRYEARKEILKDLGEGGYISKILGIKHNVGSCYRCSTVIEPRISTQWFVRMKPLAGPAQDVIRDGKTEFIPERFSKIYFHWMDSVRDWCISRQLWWGHRIPAWYCKNCKELMVPREDINKCLKCGSSDIHQDEDTLDTWFSSALWPFSVLGWPKKTKELEYFYPTNTLVTGYDIIFFWVSRMIFSSIELTGKQPFNHVLIHGLVRDEKGRKMSKSLGNGVDPLEIIEKYGADALRFSLVIGNSPGNDMRFIESKVAAGRSFANKLWNAARFIHMNIDGHDVSDEFPGNPSQIDKWIISRFNAIVNEVTNNIEKFELGLAAQKLYDFIWDEFCDWYIEMSKVGLKSGGESCINTQKTLLWIMSGMMKLLHPFMPYITEEIWQSFPHNSESIMISPYPEYDSSLEFSKQEDEVGTVMKIVKAIRNRRSEMNVPAGKKTFIYIETNQAESLLSYKELIKQLACAREVEFGNSFNIPDAVTIIAGSHRIYIPTGDLVDKEAEILRLQKELNEAQEGLKRAEERLMNQAFLSKAPDNVVNGVRDNVKKLSDRVNKITEAVSELKG